MCGKPRVRYIGLHPMNQRILWHLERKYSISGLEAASLFACRHLPSRIRDLKKAGVGIVSEWRTDSTGGKYKRYYLSPAEVSKVVGHVGEKLLTFPTHDEVKKSNPIERLRWLRFLREPANAIERETLNLIQELQK